MDGKSSGPCYTLRVSLPSEATDGVSDWVENRKAHDLSKDYSTRVPRIRGRFA